MEGKPKTSRRPKATGTIEQRGPGKWRCRIFVGTDPVTGNPRQASKTVEDLKGLVSEARLAVSNGAGHATEEIQALRSRLQDGIAGVRTKVKSAAKAVKRQAVATDKKIRAKPYHAMSIAAGAGVVAGYIIARKRAKAKA